MIHRRTITIALAGLAGLMISAWWFRGRLPTRPEAPAPREHAPAETAALVDEQQCGACHRRIAKDHQRSGHADTFHLTREQDIARTLADRVIPDPERGHSFRYHHDEKDGLSVSIPERGDGERLSLPYALGSGQHAVTFLSLQSDRFGDTFGIEHRLSLYRQGDDNDFDLTPGHRGVAPSAPMEHWGKVIRGDTLSSCLGCHTTSLRIERDQIVDLHPNVGCQSCHGSGAEHVAAKRAGSTGGIRVPQTAAQEIELCGRCHRLPSSEPSPQLSPDIVRNVRFQPANLIQSRCYQQSADLRCSTCHDPHQPVSRDVTHYVERCLSCHTSGSGKVCRVSPGEDCIRCHMPAIDVHRGIEFHDHWIRIRK